MARPVVVVSGHICTGKSGLAKRLHERFGFHRINTAEELQKIAIARGLAIERSDLQKLGDEVDQETAHDWLHTLVSRASEGRSGEHPIVVDHVRSLPQIECLRQNRGLWVTHVHLYAPHPVLIGRFQKKFSDVSSEDLMRKFEAADPIKTDDAIKDFKRDADVRINTDFTDGEDTLTRVAARLGLYPPPDVRCVDVIIGAQYGSEGKGHVAAYLSKDYDVLVRVGGPNAGHTVSGLGEVYTYHQLPSGAKDTDAAILLGPGMTIHVMSLLKEIADCSIGEDRLFIDPNAAIITDDDKKTERSLQDAISSTGSGSGATSARRIMGRGKEGTKLARDIEELRPYVGIAPYYRGSTTAQLELAYSKGFSVLLEGTQGSGLSLYHGPYPYVTSRDTNVAGCLAEAGIPPGRVRRVILVVRPTPIRVANPEGRGKTSGPLKHETSFGHVAAKAGLNASEVEAHEKTSTTRRNRRVGWFEWDQFRRACALNSPTDVALTFADYLGRDNEHARRFEQLNINTIKFIEELERVSHAPVSLVTTRFPRTLEERFDPRSVIDRRTWSTKRLTAKSIAFESVDQGSSASRPSSNWFRLQEWFAKRMRRARQ